MKSISKLKDEARRYEQREEWERAIEVYLQVLRADDESEVELTLFNRVGDLCVRLGRPLDAVRYYEEAADRYADLGLYNNAIALCNKALRYQPDHLELMRKLGQFSASQGFLTDARRYFLEYAERKFRHGETDAALAALADFAGVVDDGEIRELLGRRLHAYGRSEEALRELRTAYAMYVHTGESQRAEAVRSAILGIDPSASLDAAPAAATDSFLDRPAPQPQDELPRFEPLGAPRQDEPRPQPAPPPPPSGAAGSMTGGPSTVPAAGPPPAAAAREVAPSRPVPDTDEDEDFVELPFLDVDDDRTAPRDAPAAEPVSGFEATTLDFQAEADTPDELDLGADREREPGAFEVSDDLPYLDEDAGPPGLPLLDDDADAPEPLPLLDDSFDAFTSAFGDAFGTAADAAPEPDEAPDLPLLGDEDTADPDEAPRPDVLPLPEFGIHGERMAEPHIFEFEQFGAGPDDASAEPQADAAGTEPAAAMDPADVFDLESAPMPPLDLPDWLDTHIEPGAGVPTDDAGTRHEDASATFGFPPVGDLDLWQDEAALLRREEEPAAADDGDEDPDFWRDAPPARPHEDASVPDWSTEAVAGAMPNADADPWDADLDEEPGPPLPLLDDHDVADAMDELDLGAGSGTDLPAWSPHEEDAAGFEFGATTWNDEQPAGPEGMQDVAAEEGDLPPDDVEPFAFEAMEASAGPDTPPALESEPDDLTAAVEDGSPWETDAYRLESAFQFADAAEPAEADAAGDLDVIDADSALADGRDARDEMETVASPVPDDVDGDTPWEDGSDGGWTPDLLDGPGVTEAPATTDAVPADASSGDDGDDFVDLGALIRGDQEETTRFYVQETPPTGDEDRDFAELLRQFKAKVSQHVPAEDAVAHYDLALAYKEMGLLDEAISAFQVALRAGRMRLKIYEELGECFLQKRQFNIAEKVLSRALATTHEDELELLGVYYHLGRAYEAMGRTEQARDAYERVLGMDLGFQDVAERLSRL